MILSALSKVVIMYFGVTDYEPIMNMMNGVVMFVLGIKATIVLLSFILGEWKDGKPNFAR